MGNLGGDGLATATVPLPFITAYDPPVEGEGRLDPLGLGPLADRISDSYARPVRARMKRIRFLTSMALGGKLTPELMDVSPAVPGDTPEIAFERVVIEALARASARGLQLDTGIPGITKAQAALIGKSRLGARGYLKGPKVFGFFGVYRPLAAATGMLDAQGGTLAPGDSLLEALRRDASRSNRYESDPSSMEFLEWLTQAAGDGLREGHNTFRPKSPHAQTLAAIAAPQLAGRSERAALSNVLHSPEATARAEDENAYLEVLRLLADAPQDLDSEVDLVEFLRAQGSQNVESRMTVLLAFEEFGRDLLWAFDSYRFLSGQIFGRAPSDAALAEDEAFAAVGSGIAQRYQVTLAAMERATEFGADLEIPTRFSHAFSDFDRQLNPLELLEALMVHHERVQGAKPPNGKRPWLESVNGRWTCRPLFYPDDVAERRTGFIHPYRLDTLVKFLADVHD